MVRMRRTGRFVSAPIQCIVYTVYGLNFSEVRFSKVAEAVVPHIARFVVVGKPQQAERYRISPTFVNNPHSVGIVPVYAPLAHVTLVVSSVGSATGRQL